MLRCFFLMLFVNFSAVAGVTSCTWPSMTITMPTVNVVVQKNAVIGQKIGSIVTGSSSNVVCTYSGTQSFQRLLIRTSLIDSGVKDGEIKIWKTNVPGIGVAIGFKGVTNDSYAESWDDFIGQSGHSASGSYWVTSLGNSLTTFSWLNVTPEYQLYKIADSADSGVLSGTFASFSANTEDMPNDGSGIPSPNINFGNSTVTVLKCDINSPALFIDMGDVPVSDFKNGVGSVSRTSETKNIDMDCDKDANVKMLLEGTLDENANTPSVLKLNSVGEGNAEGIGVQIIYNGSPIDVGKVIQIVTSKGGGESITLSARYIQTTSAIKAGKGNAIATLNIIYQ